MFRNIKNVIYKKNSMLAFEEYFQIENYEGRYALRYSDNKYKDKKIENVDYELVMEYFDQLFRIIDGWKSEYKNSQIIDGTEWNLQIIYKDGEIKQYTGRNDCPSNFEYLDIITYKIVNKILES